MQRGRIGGWRGGWCGGVWLGKGIVEGVSIRGVRARMFIGTRGGRVGRRAARREWVDCEGIERLGNGGTRHAR